MGKLPRWEKAFGDCQRCGRPSEETTWGHIRRVEGLEEKICDYCYDMQFKLGDAVADIFLRDV